MSENGDDKRPSHSEESHNASEPASPAKTQDPLNVSSSAGDTSPTFRSTSAPASSSITLESPQATRQTENEDTVSQNGRQQSPSATEVGDSKLPLEDFDWDDIEERFCRKMEEFAKTEKELDEEFGEWLQVCSRAHLAMPETASGLMGSVKGIQGLEFCHQYT